MRSISYKNDLQVLQDFLYELVCEVKQPEQTELLVEVLLKIERPLDKVRDDRWAVTPIDRARIHK
jgi:7,8-dihydro-6-hydroxymethylpterin-pyrophosphokinase